MHDLNKFYLQPGVLSPQLLQQDHPSKFYGTIPIKKRKLPLMQTLSPVPDEKPLRSDSYEFKEEKDSSIPDRGLSLCTSEYVTPPGKADVSKNLDSSVKGVTDSCIESTQINKDLSVSKVLEVNTSSSLGFYHSLKTRPDLLEEKKATEPGVDFTHVLNVKQENASGEIEGNRLELSMGLKNVGQLGMSKTPIVHPLECKISESVSQMSGQSDLSSLSLSLSQERIVSLDHNNSSNSGDVSSELSVNRSNWDLNMTMEDWGGSLKEETLVYKTAGIGRFNMTSARRGLKSSSNGFDASGISLNNRQPVLDKHKYDCSNESVQSSQQDKPNDNLSLTLAIPSRQFDASDEHSSLSNNTGSGSTDPNLNWRQLQLSNVNLRTSCVDNLKSEPVDENFKLDCNVDSSCKMTASKLDSKKLECVENHILESVSRQKLDHAPIKLELVQEDNVETLKSADAVLSQSVGKIFHSQENSSSSVAAITLTPQISGPSRFSTCLEFPMSNNILNESENSLQLKESNGHRNITEKSNDVLALKSAGLHAQQLRLCKPEALSVQYVGSCKLAVDGHSSEQGGTSEAYTNEEEKINMSAETIEEGSFGSDCKSYGSNVFSVQIDAKGKMYAKEDGEYEDGEVREPSEPKDGEASILHGTSTENVLRVESDNLNKKSSGILVDQDADASEFDEKDTVRENYDETSCEKIKMRVVNSNEITIVNESLQNPFSDVTLEVDENSVCAVSKVKEISKVKEVSNVKEINKKSVCAVSVEKPFDSSERESAKDGHGIEVSTATKEGHGLGITLEGDVVDKIVEMCPGKFHSTLSKVETSAPCSDDVKDSNSVVNKSRIINLPLTSAVSTAGKSGSFSSRLLNLKTGKKQSSDLDGKIHSRRNRDTLHTDDHDKFVEDRFHGRSFRDSKQSFMLGKGRVLGRFGPLHNEWGSDRNYTSGTYSGRNNYQVSGHKRASSFADELECNEYDITPDDSSLGSCRKKTMNDDLPSLRYPRPRRLSSGDREGQVTKGVQMQHRFHRNGSPNRYTAEDDTDFSGLCHGHKFMRPLPDEMTNPVFPRPRSFYDELDCQLVRGCKSFPNLNRKNYSRIRSKSPARSRTRSPLRWSSPHQRSPNGLPELNRHRSPVLYRMGRMRSPEESCYRDEIVSSRHMVSRHTNDMRDLDSGREHIHPLSAHSNRGSPHGMLFPRGTGRSNVCNSQERTDDGEYSNEPVHSSKFEELHCDGSFDERGNFTERLRFIRPYQSRHSRDSRDYQFHLNDGPRPYRFGHDNDTAFSERSSMQEREFDGHMKHSPSRVSRRVRDVEEHPNRNPEPDGRMWHGDGYSDVSRVKRRRF